MVFHLKENHLNSLYEAELSNLVSNNRAYNSNDAFHFCENRFFEDIMGENRKHRIDSRNVLRDI